MLHAGLSLFASAGNEADMSVLDYMEYGISHQPTRVIALLVDSLADGPRFRRLALAAHAAGKHVVALKIGGSEAGAAAAVAHSSRLAGDDASYRALFAVSGVASVKTLEGLMTAAALLDRYGSRPGKLGSLSTSGAGASLIADRCAALDVPLATLTPATHAAIDRQKMFSRIGNPLDMGIFGGMQRSADVPSMLMNDPGVSVGLALVHSMNPWQGDAYRAAMAKAREVSGKPLLVVTPGGMPEAERQSYAASGIDVFTETDILLEGIGALLTAPPEPIPVRSDAPTLAAPLPHRPLTEPESLRLLVSFGVAAVQTIECRSSAEVVAAAARIGYPVVLKGVAEGVSHKSDLGLVHVGLRDADAVALTYAALGCPNVVVQAMIQGGLEAIAGIARADGVGLVLVAGLGGIFAEALHDVRDFCASGQPRPDRGWTGQGKPGAGPDQSALETSWIVQRIHRSADVLAASSVIFWRHTASYRHQPRHHRGRRRGCRRRAGGAGSMSGRFTVTYDIRCGAAEIEARAQEIAVEQSVEMPLAAIDDVMVLSDIVGSVQGIADIGGGVFRVRIGLATATVGHDAGQLLNMVFGNTSLHDDVALMDIAIPESLVQVFGGPRHGIAEFRFRLKLHGRALTASALKPQGLAVDALAALAEKLACGGLDFIKDDHGLADQRYSRFAERVSACAAGVARGARSTGHPTRYVPSLTGNLDQLRVQAALARDLGLDCVMLAPMVCGFPAMQAMVRDFPEMAFFAHPSMAGAGKIAPDLLIGKLFRLMGADAVIFPSFGGRFGYSQETCRLLADNARRIEEGMGAALPVPAGGMTVERTGEILDFYGEDTMLLIGGSLLMGRDRVTEETERFTRAVAGHILA